MKTTFIEVFREYAKTASTNELVELKEVINVALYDFEGRAREIKNSKGPFDCVKFVREKTGWGLEECRRFMIQL